MIYDRRRRSCSPGSPTDVSPGVRADAMASIISNYSVLHELWDWSLGDCSVTEINAQIRGEQVYMQQFEFFFDLVLGRDQLENRPTDRLSVCFCK